MESSQKENEGASLAHESSGNSRVRGAALASRRKKDAAQRNSCGFSFRCEPRSSHRLIASPGLSLYLSQMIYHEGRAQIWESLTLHCDEESDGTLVIRVLVSNPDWEQPLQIACLRSRPHDAESMTPLACNLNHEEVSG